MVTLHEIATFLRRIAALKTFPPIFVCHVLSVDRALSAMDVDNGAFGVRLTVVK
jgi:hypothetical protein